MSKPILYSYWRSSCSWRVRIALELKNIDYEYRAVHLVKDGGEQHSEAFQRINSMEQVPAFVVDDVILTQSLAIMEFLEEFYPGTPQILPPRDDAVKRAKVRQICEVINAGTQPLQNLSVMNKHSKDAVERQNWSHHWIQKGLRTVEVLLSDDSKFCVGEEITLADCCLIPQVYNANRFKVDMQQFPKINRVLANLEKVEAVQKAHPDRQPDRQ